MGSKSTSTDSGAFYSRQISILINLEEIKKNFFWGRGPGYLYELSYQDDVKKQHGLNRPESVINSNRNGTVFFLGELFNTGIFGLIIVLCFLFFIWQVLGGVKTSPTKNLEHIQFVDGVKLMFINALIVSLSNTVIKMVFLWIFIGIGCKIAVQYKKERGQNMKRYIG
jgi:hypothetical protein